MRLTSGVRAKRRIALMEVVKKERSAQPFRVEHEDVFSSLGPCLVEAGVRGGERTFTRLWP